MLLAAAFLLAGCFDDDSTYADGNAVGEIVVTGMEENYSKTAYIGEMLTITPEVQSYVDEQNMTYRWLLLDANTGTEDKQGNVVEPTVIATEKNLNYEVAIGPGTYQLRLEATASPSGYTVYKTAMLTVRTTFSQGFYVLKETADGNTDLDLLTLEGKQGENLMAQVGGAPLKGEPQSLTPLYSMSYINTDNDQMENTNAIAVTTTTGDMKVCRTSDFKTIFDRSNIRFEEMDNDEKPYGFFLSVMYMNMLTNKGLYSIFSSENAGANSGRFGYPTSTCGGSRYYFSDQVNAYGGGACWDESTHSLLAFDYNMQTTPLTYDDFTGEELTQNLTGSECLHCGYNYMSNTSTGLFVLENKAEASRYLYLADCSFFGVYLTKCIRMAPESHAAKATSYSTCGQSASYLYCVDGGKLYVCNFNDDTLPEVEIKPQGIGSGETITMVTNQYWMPSSGQTTFDYLIVGTTVGDGYKLYFYETNGGAPQGQPVYTLTGKGKVKCVRFINDSFNSFDWFVGPTFGITD